MAGTDDGNSRMIPFEMAEPASLKEAVAMLDPQEPMIRPVAGGTALMLMMKAGVFRPTRLVSLHRLEPEYAHIAMNGSGEIRIGAMAPSSATPTLPRVCRCSSARCAPFRTPESATLPGSAAHSLTATRTWTCHRCS